MKQLLRFLNPRRKIIEKWYDKAEAEIEQSKEVKKEAKKELIDKNEKIQKTIIENHFTIYITGAVGRNRKRKSA